MALAKLGLSFSDIKGKIGGTVFQSYHGKTMLRNVHTNKEQAKASGQSIQPLFALVQASWRLTTEAERKEWSNAATLFLFTDKFGDQYIGSGYQLFISCNLVRISHGGALSNIPPISNLSGLGPSGEEVDIIGMNTPSIAVSWIDDGYPAPNRFVISSSPPVSSSVTKPPARFAQITERLLSSLALSNIVQDFTAKYGFALRDNQVFWFKFQTVDPVNGFMGAPRYRRILYADNQ